MTTARQHRQLPALLLTSFSLLLTLGVSAQSTYYPPAGTDWEKRTPSTVGMDSLKLAHAIAFSQAHEIDWLMSMKEQLTKQTAKEPYPAIQGPYKDRGHVNGIILRHGYIVAEWGDTKRVDMTFSVAKSYLSGVAGLAFDRGLIDSVDEKVSASVHDGGFDGEHNAAITWRMMFNQTNEWEGTLWGKPDVADRRAGYARALQAPGTFWEYNDVRVNRTSLALLELLQEPLPQVIKREIMDRIGASETWVWHGYDNAYIDIGGKQVQSVSGGGHWGAGFWASTRDHARYGYLMLRRGRWSSGQLLSERWIAMATTPTPIKPVYGFMWWLNPGRQQFPDVPETNFFALGAGGNTIWIDPDHDLVAVVRWLDPAHQNEFMKLVLAAIGP